MRPGVHHSRTDEARAASFLKSSGYRLQNGSSNSTSVSAARPLHAFLRHEEDVRASLFALISGRTGTRVRGALAPSCEPAGHHLLVLPCCAT